MLTIVTNVYKYISYKIKNLGYKIIVTSYIK